MNSTNHLYNDNQKHDKHSYSNLFNTDNRFYINLIDGRYVTPIDTSCNLNNDDFYSKKPENRYRSSKYISHLHILTEKEKHNDVILYSDRKTMKIKYGFNTQDPLEYELFYNKIHSKYPYFKDNYIEQLYFHYILVIGNYNDIYNWLLKYIERYSMDKLETLLNTPISVPIKYNGKNDVYYLYPINSYCLWNDDPKGIRLLVSFGVEIFSCDNFGYYPEEAIRNISYFHPIPFLVNADNMIENTIDIIDLNNKTIYYRNQHEFNDVINEIRYVAGEDISMNWTYPI